jgi:hypothetical protein
MYAAKIPKINKLTDAVNVIAAVLEANNAENTGFPKDILRNLQDTRTSEATWDSYLKKLKEQHAIYQNHRWRLDYNPWNSLLGVYDSFLARLSDVTSKKALRQP